MVTQTGTKYEVEPAVIKAVSNFLQEQVRYGSLGMQNIPVETALQPTTQNYEYYKKDYEIGIGFEMDVVTPPDSQGDIEKVEVAAPIVYSNYGFTYDQWRRISASRYGLQERLADQISEMSVRQDLITYIGDTKHSINALGSATPGTEITTQLDVSTTALANLTFSKAFGQLKTALKYNGLITPMSTIIVEWTPDIEQVASGTSSTNEDFTVKDAVLAQMQGKFGSASRIVENPYLGGSYTVNKAGVHSISEGSDKILIYVSDPRVMKLVDSPMELRMSPLDPTKGRIVQPVKRLTRIDVEALGVLIETDVKIA